MIANPDVPADWRAVDFLPVLGDEVQVYRLSLMTYKALWSECFATLDKSERDRATRIRTDRPRDQFVLGRAILRRLLGHALGCKSHSVAFSYNLHGKPEIDGQPLCFNVAHSGDLVLIALSRLYRVGVDVESVDSNLEVLEIAEQAFHPVEIASIRSLERQEDRVAAFYRCWCRREAFTKADGRGLTMPSNEFPFDLLGRCTTRADYDVTLCDLSCGVGYIGALAIIGDNLDRKCHFYEMSLSAVQRLLMNI